MICPRCGGNFRNNKPCDTCGITYEELIKSIRHDEMKKLFVKIGDMIEHHEDFTIEESLLAVELKNSSLLIPAKIVDGSLGAMTVEDEKNRRFITLYTDIDEYENAKTGIEPLTNPFSEMVHLLDERLEGFVINKDSVACEIPKNFLKKYFADDLRT